ncbi:response regulator transcription factor [Brevundimonas sp.]|uniref:response regulator transcription factor n=1 Tax=Brevundimonas sp. TaxID=1871086 RepID=UPI002FC8CB24
MAEAPDRPSILLVEDDPAVVNALKFSLELEGFEVRAYADGETLLASTPLPTSGCLVLDYNLPGMDGLNLLERLRASNVDLPAILITTNPRRALRMQAALAGVEIVEKPLLTDALRDSVRCALGAEAAV